MNIVAIIPARYASSRFPGKPLADICGIPMIERVYRNVAESKIINEVWVATDDNRIMDRVISFGGKCMLTSTKHQTGSDRVAEAAMNLSADIVVNVQGDEPLIQGEDLDQLVFPLTNEKELMMATLKTKIIDEREIENPNVVKVIANKGDYAIYFSRSPIPYNRDNIKATYYKHVGIYAYRSDFLRKFVEMKPTDLEISESLEQLRVIQNGIPIKVIETEKKMLSVDTPADLANVELFLQGFNVQ